SIAALVSVYSIIFIGGYVSASGLGLSCPDWPLCNGQVLPSSDYLIEWTHRFVAALTGVLVISTAALAWSRKKTETRIRLTSVLAAIFVIAQITLGFIVIEAKLHPLLVAIHLGIGVLLFASALLTALFANRIDKHAKLETKKTF
ncbi:MAG: heme A synthase, partial [Nitrososphaerales archaeon]